MPHRRAVLLALLPAACAAPGAISPYQGVTLPPSAQPPGAGDPVRGAILASAYVFGQPSSVAGNPAAAAEALGQLEYLAVEIPTGPTWRDFDPLVGPMLVDGRAEARAAMGLSPGLSAQSAVDALYATAAALRAGNRAGAEAALAPVAPNPGATLGRLAALPYLPRAAAATTAAQRALTQRERRRDSPRMF
jgi:hypothetical protein